jgi:hypothetical protein
MAEPIKSALFVDYESLHRSLTGVDAATDARLADRAAAWLRAIETGQLIDPEGLPRRIVVRRCYAGPGVRGKQRDMLAAAGFSVVDVGADNGVRSSSDLHIAMDTIDALSRPDGPDDFIILSGGAELAPLLMRLHGAKRSTAIYVDAMTAEADRSLADATLTAAAFATFLTTEEEAPLPPQPAGIDRADIEAFARKIHAATNIPLFSPKTFAELFRHLTDEISENGYHFQSTAKNVADRLTAAGRTVTRRQVVFIVKGLALKGHVFSTGDTAEGLAEVFREQAHYLITNAGMTLDDKQELLLSAWFKSSGAPTAAAAATPAAAPARAPAPPAPAEPARAATETQAEPPAAARLKPPAPQKPTAQAKPPVVKPVELPKSAARPVAVPPPQGARPGPSSAAREEAKAVIAARIAASAKLKPSRGVPVPAKPAPKAPPPPRPAQSHGPAQGPAQAPGQAHAQAKPAPAAPPGRAPQASKTNSDALEHSILAAIAEAVDVLVEDSADEPGSARPQPQRRPAATENQRRPAAPSPARNDKRDATPAGSPNETDDGDEGGDIGDQIQRIIASYNRNRTDE